MMQSPMQDLRSRAQYNPRKDNLNKIFSTHLNITSIRKKLDQLADLIKRKIDVLMISESKIDDSIPDSQFFLDGYCDAYGTGIEGLHSAPPQQKNYKINSAAAAFILNLNLTQ